MAKKKTKLKRLQKKYNNLAVEYELTRGNFEDFAESSVEQAEGLLKRVAYLETVIIFRDRTIHALKEKLVRSERGKS